jgi:hypothetical protein
MKMQQGYRFFAFARARSKFSFVLSFTALPIKVYGMGASRGNLKLPFGQGVCIKL